MQPAATSADGASGVKLIKGEATGKGVVPVNEERWWKRKVEDVPVDELFFHKFFSRKNEMEKAKVAKVEKRKGRDEDSSTEASGNEDEDEDVEEPEGGSDEKGEGSDEEEAEIWQVCQSLPHDGKFNLPALLGNEIYNAR